MASRTRTAGTSRPRPGRRLMGWGVFQARSGRVVPTSLDLLSRTADGLAGPEVLLGDELPVLRAGVERVVRDDALGRVAVLVERELAQDGVVAVGRVGHVRADLLAVGADVLERLEDDLRAGIAGGALGAGLRPEHGL